MNVGVLTVTFSILAFIATGQNVPQSTFSTLARQPNVRTVWSKEAGRLLSHEAQAVFTAVKLEDASRAARGVRIDFSWAGKQGALYLEEALLQPQKNIFDQLAKDIERGTMPLGGVLGTCEFRNHPGTYPLEADYYSGLEAPALRIFGPSKEPILFPKITVLDLSKILGNAIDQLQGNR